MSSSKDEQLLLKLSLFETAVPHAWVNWTSSDEIVIEESTCPEILAEGAYAIDRIAKSPEHAESHWKDIDSEVLVTEFEIQNQGQECSIKCASIKSDQGIQSLWFILPEKDNSIFFLQNAAHDIRSPLASILGVVNLMHHSLKLDQMLDREEFTTLLDMIKVNTDKTLRLADEIMELAEIESDGYVLSRSAIVMEDFIQNYLATHRLLTLKKKIKVHFESSSKSKALINETKFTRALDNVMSNAVKFSNTGSEIKVKVEDHQGSVVVSIVDQGIGMSPEILKNVFVKFGSSKRTGLDGEASHGLGMSIVQQILSLHEGEVTLSSTEGKGTNVQLILNKVQ